MRTKNFIFLILFLYTASAIGQTVKWERVYGGREYEYGRSVIQGLDSTYVVAGSSSSYNAAMDMYLICLKKDGSFKWHHAYGGGNDEWAYSVKQTPIDSGYILCGFSNTWGNTGYDVYLVKTDKNGNMLWERTYGGSDWDFGYSVDLTSDGGYILAGSTYSYGSGSEDAFLIKTDAAGNEQWFNVYGGFSDDNFTEVHQIFGGGYVMSGRTKSFGAGDYDMWVVKTTPTSDIAWTYVYGSIYEDGLNSIKQTPDSGFITVGYTFGNQGGTESDNYILKLTSTGVVQGIPNNDLDPSKDSWMQSVWPNSDGTFFTVGYYKPVAGIDYSFNFAKWDPWLNYMACCNSSRGGLEEEFAYSGQQTFDKGFIIAGNTNSWGNGKTDLYIVKLDSNFIYTNIAVVGLAPEQTRTELELFPNPASDRVYFEIEEGKLNGRIELKVLDVLGRELRSLSAGSAFTSHGMDRYAIPVADLEEGIYFLEISDDQNSFIGRIIVKH